MICLRGKKKEGQKQEILDASYGPGAGLLCGALALLPSPQGAGLSFLLPLIVRTTICPAHSVARMAIERVTIKGFGGCEKC